MATDWYPRAILPGVFGPDVRIMLKRTPGFVVPDAGVAGHQRIPSAGW
jgi:hypothetical protein